MKDQPQNNQRLLAELAETQARVAALEAAKSEAEQAAHALRESEDRYRLLVEAIPQPVWRCDANGERIESNGRWYEYTGQTPDGARGFGWMSAVHPDDRGRILGRIREILAGGPNYEAEYRLRRASDGRYRWHLARALPTRDKDGRITGWFGSATDIHDQRQAEKALRQARDELEQRVKERTAELAASNEALRQIYEGMSEGLAIVDAETKRILRVNPALCRMLGYAEEELLSMSITDIHPPEETATTLERIGERAGGTLREHRDVVMLRKDGTAFPADVMGNPLRYGGRLCVLGLFRDVTQRRQAQKAAERERQTLKHLLESSDRERQLIAYEIHDGLAQQLAGAIMQLQAYEHLKDTDPDGAAKALDAGMTMLRRGHFEARRLISGVRPLILDEEGIVAAVAHLVNERRQTGLQITFQSEVAFGRLVPILENAVYRIVQEALTNACKHSRSPQIQVELRQLGDVLRVGVQDWGLGFDPAGVGEDRFGLTGIRERTRLLGGTVRIETAAGQGTRLTVELPLLPRE